jgi:hypothetical protein
MTVFIYTHCTKNDHLIAAASSIAACQSILQDGISLLASCAFLLVACICHLMSDDIYPSLLYYNSTNVRLSHSVLIPLCDGAFALFASLFTIYVCWKFWCGVQVFLPIRMEVLLFHTGQTQVLYCLCLCLCLCSFTISWGFACKTLPWCNNARIELFSVSLVLLQYVCIWACHGKSVVIFNCN